MLEKCFVLLALASCEKGTQHAVTLGKLQRPAATAVPAPTQGPWLQELRDAGGELVALFSPPLAVRERRPLAVGLHGMADHPSSACGGWRGTLGAYPFVLCPFGHRPVTLERAIAALHARYPDHLDLQAPLVAGFSLGSILLPSLVAESKTRFTVAIMAEGYPRQGLVPWKAALETRGVRRLLLVNVQPANRERGADVVRLLRGGPVTVRNVYLGTSAHVFSPFLAKSIRTGLLAWLDDLPGWQGYAPPALDAP